MGLERRGRGQLTQRFTPGLDFTQGELLKGFNDGAGKGE